MEDSLKGMAHYSVPPKICYFIPLGQKSKSNVELKFSHYFSKLSILGRCNERGGSQQLNSLSKEDSWKGLQMLS